MKRNLLTQIKNEWRDNLWLVIELTVVTCVIWMIGITLFKNVEGYFLPRGFDYENVYTFSTKALNENSPHYVAPEADEESPYNRDIVDLVRRLRKNPHVEAAAITIGATPYNYNYSGWVLNRVDKTDSLSYYGNMRQGTPDMVKVLGLKSSTGKTADQLEQMLARGELLISNSQIFIDEGRDVNELIGAQMILGTDSSKVYRIGDVIQKIRRNDYEDTWGGTIVKPILEDNSPWGLITLKVRDGHEMRFKEDFRNNIDLRQQRNVYISDMQKLADTREACQRSIETSLRQMGTLMLFLLVTIFLGLLGAFWFRIQQRISEIAMRKVCGATKSAVFRRILGEGMILLLIATILASALIWPFWNTFEEVFYCTWKEFLVFELIGVAIVAAGIVISLWYPARKAMAIEPAIALKGE